jgi:hypothetical protein
VAAPIAIDWRDVIDEGDEVIELWRDGTLVVKPLRPGSRDIARHILWPARDQPVRVGDGFLDELVAILPLVEERGDSLPGLDAGLVERTA